MRNPKQLTECHSSENPSQQRALRIALVGPYPPPYGGISNHIYRLEAHLKGSGHEVNVYRNQTVRGWLVAARGKWWRYDLVHFHDMGWKGRTAIGLLGCIGLRTILTIHGGSLGSQLADLSAARLKLFRFGLRHITHIISVFPEARELLLSIGVAETRTSVIHSYLPPIITYEDRANIPQNIQDFLASHKLILAANGFEATSWGEEDLYGIGMCIELCSILKTDYPELGFLFYLARPGDTSLLNKYTKCIAEKKLQDRFRFVFGQPFPPILPRTSIFLRPTFQDGYGISVAEAIDSGVPTIASDVCPRAPGTILFKPGDLADLTNQVRNILEHYPESCQNIANYHTTSILPDILNIYQEIAH